MIHIFPTHFIHVLRTYDYHNNKKKIMSLNNVNRLVLVREKKCVPREVGTELMNRFIMTGVFAGHPPRWFGFDSRPIHVGVLVKKLSVGQVCVAVLRFSAVSITARMLHTILLRYEQNDKRAKPEDLPRTLVCYRKWRSKGKEK